MSNGENNNGRLVLIDSLYKHRTTLSERWICFTFIPWASKYYWLCFFGQSLKSRVFARIEYEHLGYGVLTQQ